MDVVSTIILSIMAVGFLFWIYFLFFMKHRHGLDEELREQTHSRIVSHGTKAFWMWITQPLENLLVKYKIQPNTISWVSLGLAGVACVGYSFGWFLFAGWAVIFSGTCDYFDGRVARRLNLTSQSGAFLDANFDRLGEAFWFLGLMNYYTNTLFFYVVFIALMASMMISYTKARGEGMGVEASMGSMQRPERIVWIGVPSIFSPLFSALTNYFIPVSTTFLASVGIAVVAVMSCHTYYQRYTHIYSTLKKQG